MNALSERNGNIHIKLHLFKLTPSASGLHYRSRRTILCRLRGRVLCDLCRLSIPDVAKS